MGKREKKEVRGTKKRRRERKMSKRQRGREKGKRKKLNPPKTKNFKNSLLQQAVPVRPVPREPVRRRPHHRDQRGVEVGRDAEGHQLERRGERPHPLGRLLVEELDRADEEELGDAHDDDLGRCFFFFFECLVVSSWLFVLSKVRFRRKIKKRKRKRKDPKNSKSRTRKKVKKKTTLSSYRSKTRWCQSTASPRRPPPPASLAR